jgi:uncharacterized protein
MSAACVATVCGEALHLLPERAVWWPAQSALLLADLHFGKAATLRAHGIPVPRGSSSATLGRLDALIERYAVRRVVFLGDFLHARRARSTATLSALRAWRERRATLQLQLVLGNHDRHAGPPPADLRIDALSEPFVMTPFVMRHLPVSDPQGYVIAGHLHPAVRLHGTGHDFVQLPCFVFGAATAVLPAFGELTGTSVIDAQPGQRVYACAGERVLALPVIRDATGGTDG